MMSTAVSNPASTPASASTSPSTTPPSTRHHQFITSLRNNVKLHHFITRVQGMLIENGVNHETLGRASHCLRPIDYDQVVEERVNDKRCGWAACTKHLSEDVQSSQRQYRLSLSSHSVYDVRPTLSYCSDTCFNASRLYRATLSDEPSWMREWSQTVTGATPQQPQITAAGTVTPTVKATPQPSYAITVTPPSTTTSAPAPITLPTVATSSSPSPSQPEILIREKDTASTPIAPFPTTDTIEGHRPRTIIQKDKRVTFADEEKPSVMDALQKLEQTPISTSTSPSTSEPTKAVSTLTPTLTSTVTSTATPTSASSASSSASVSTPTSTMTVTLSTNTGKTIASSTERIEAKPIAASTSTPAPSTSSSLTQSMANLSLQPKPTTSTTASSRPIRTSYITSAPSTRAPSLHDLVDIKVLPPLSSSSTPLSYDLSSIPTLSSAELAAMDEDSMIDYLATQALQTKSIITQAQANANNIIPSQPSRISLFDPEKSLKRRKNKQSEEVQEEKMGMVPLEHAPIQEEKMTVSDHAIIRSSLSPYTAVLDVLIQWCTRQTSLWVANQPFTPIHIPESFAVQHTNRHTHLCARISEHTTYIYDKLAIRERMYERYISMLVETMCLERPIPTLSVNTWRFLTLLFLRLISLHLGTAGTWFPSSDNTRLQSLLQLLGFTSTHLDMAIDHIQHVM